MASILVVEDNAMNLELVRDLLTFRGHTLREASDVQGALQRLAELPPDLVLLDIQIPGGGGLAVLQAMKASESLRSIPVVAVTAFAMRGDEQRLLADGFDGYVSKPIDVRQFGPLIESYLSRSQKFR